MKRNYWLSVFLIAILVFNTLAVFAEAAPEYTDTGATDTGVTDTGATDTGATDTGATDTGATDTGVTDTGATDTGATDTGATDTGATDTGATDTGDTDTGDTGIVDPDDRVGASLSSTLPVLKPEIKVLFDQGSSSQLIKFFSNFNLPDNEYTYKLGLRYKENGNWVEDDTTYNLEHFGKYDFEWNVRPDENEFFCFRLHIFNKFDNEISVVDLPTEFEWVDEFVVKFYICFSYDTVTATKVWAGPEEEHPSVWFQLYLKGDCGKKPIGCPKELESGQTQVSWEVLNIDIAWPWSLFLCDYVVEELPIDGYHSEVTGNEVDGFIVTNTKILPSTVSVKGIKVWMTGPGEDPFKRPDVSLQLYQNDKPHGEPIVLKSKTYSYVWNNLPEFDENDKAYTYRVEEINVPKDYKMSVCNVGNIYTITNKWIGKSVPDKPDTPDKPDKPVKPVTPTKPYKPSLPKTGTDASGLYLGFVALAAGMKLLLSDRKNKN